MANGGFFAGGVAEGLLAGRELGLRDRALDLAEQAQMDEQRRALHTEGKQAISNTLDIIGKTIGGIKDSSPLTGGIDLYGNAIASIESAGSGDWLAIGPETENGHRAYGRYQVMDFNIGPWTREILGKEMTPQEFLADQQAQQKVFNVKFGQYINETGSPEGAAAKWFGTGVDVNGVSTEQYVEKFSRGLITQPRERMRKTVAPLLKDVEELAEAMGEDPTRYRNQVEAIIESTPIGAETAIREGEMAAQKKIGEFNNLVRAGVNEADAMVTAGIQKAKTTGEGTGVMDPKEVLTIENNMRDDYTKLSGEFIKVRDSFGRVQSSAQNPSPAGDLAMIFNYMKMLDPGSTVREGEFATAQNSTGLYGKSWNLYNQVVNGARLNDDQRKDFLGQAQRMFNVAEKQQTILTERFRKIAERAAPFGVNPENVIIDFGADGEPVTTITDGIPDNFLAGREVDPAVRQRAWEIFQQNKGAQ